MLRELETVTDITTRLYPVKLEEMKERVAKDLKARFDFALHLGQAPRASCIEFEEIAINVATEGKSVEASEIAGLVDAAGPVAYRSQLPLQDFANSLREGRNPGSRFSTCRDLLV